MGHGCFPDTQSAIVYRICVGKACGYIEGGSARPCRLDKAEPPSGRLQIKQKALSSDRALRFI
ncbi:hypothetical protein E4898_23565 [Salmonella enterica subsp. enterica serovar Anatum]|uniref:Uncharacterized protein n=7 Tax=Salmonella enterica I TaxID=59201 RepID=A0A5X9W699_SALIN|nr:hypothetical protein ELZ88_22245 [Salmonella enterica subsp. enterica serovar Karamoja]EAM1644373.1 hypothetical protein [Salmonella enterica]EAO4279266.1 hypothetical protein [Salmonella enterica subsp. enterica]EAQ1469023.1 hypothetical protein [Salmonella enterica subsp. enterica serovar Infantis]EBH8383213.1 hypothetical protein [Salmonella enterica subsp. enterica serovar 4,5,12:b:-]EBH9943202.1 hypothetical protein [Salmonella enterica subsp. enterica serovar Braenderup]EBH9960890.1 